MRNYTVEDIQKINQRPTPLPPGFKSIPFIIPNEYRERAVEKLAPLLEPFKAEIGWDWQQDKCEPITGEWIIPEDLMNDQDTPDIDIPTLLYFPGGAYHICSIQTHRFLTSRAAKVWEVLLACYQRHMLKFEDFFAYL
jgi:acetyl esterase/lipase